MSSFKTKFFSFLLLICFACSSPHANLEDGIYAEIQTTKGTITAKLHHKKAPLTTANFVSLAEGYNIFVNDTFKNKKFYDGTIFHRVVKDTLIQGGDPFGNGNGNPGYRFMDEFHPDLKHDKPGILAMANAGKNTNGSQFYISKVNRPELDNKHSIFGEMIDGFDVLDSILQVPTSKEEVPLDSIQISKLNIIRIGKDAENFDANKVFKYHFAKKQKEEKAKKARQEKLKNETREKHLKQKKTAVTLDSGVRYFISEKGNGEPLKIFSRAMAHYALFLENGTLLNTSNLSLAEAYSIVKESKKVANRYVPIKADLGPDAPMIAGFKEGMQQLNVGDKATLFIPYHLAYGEAGNSGIPPKTNLIFEVEILSLAK